MSKIVESIKMKSIDSEGQPSRSNRKAAERRKLVFGLPVVFAIAVSWVGATQTGKSTCTPHYNAPFSTVWFSTLWMILCFPLYVCIRLLLTKDTLPVIWRGCRCVISVYNTSCVPDRAKFLVDALLVAGPFTALWLVTNYVYLRALCVINPADVTALFSSAPAFVFIFSCIFLGEPFLILPLMAVCLAITGIVLFSYAEGFKGASGLGIALSVGAAVGAALYKVLRLKETIGSLTRTGVLHL